MSILRRFRPILERGPLLLALAISVIVATGGGVQPTTAGHEDWPENGIICTSNATSTFTLVTQTGYISQPDGNAVFMWGLSESGQPFQHPSPILCVNEGKTVTIVVKNTLPDNISLVFPGQENVLANGAPSQPQWDASGNLVSLAPEAEANGGSVTYSFVAESPGTYLYESGTEPLKQVNMGLFGAIIVRPTGYDPGLGHAYAYTGESSRYNPATEYILLLSEIDPMLHMAVEQGLPYNMNNYVPRYWLMNGRSFPDTIAPNGAVWLPNQPYGSLIHIHPKDVNPYLDASGTPTTTVTTDANPAYNPEPALIRYLSVGSEDYPHHPHGNHERIIARDGNELVATAPYTDDLSYERFTIVVGPGQTMDATFYWEDVDKWDPNENPIPVTIPQLQNLVFGTFYSGSPYLGNEDQLPVGTQVLNQCGEYYHIAHNHALHQITAWGVVLSGHITFARIDPPLPNSCP
ncbi:MAG: multicopper oxidase domain-containing protein [Anaerolineae bacterium]|nr:multicopper oxidase domain-containing protein [Anaerolineae bacterium]